MTAMPPQQRDSYRADLTQLEACIGAFVPLLDRSCLIVGKCTVPVGTASHLSEQLSLLAAGTELA
jgi:UDPglucose 6-dehydrogenase